MQDLLHAWRTQLDTRFPQVDGVFESCMAEASRVLTPDGMEAYLQYARFLGKMGRGASASMSTATCPPCRMAGSKAMCI